MKSQIPGPPPHSPSGLHSPEQAKSISPAPSRRAVRLTGLGVFGVMVTMAALGLGLALWTQPIRRARDLPKVVAGPDRLVEAVARGADLVIWAKGDFPNGNDRLLELLPGNILKGAGTSGDHKVPEGNAGKGHIRPETEPEISGRRFLAIPHALGLGKSAEWALSLTFGTKSPNMREWVRIAIQLESPPIHQNQTKISEIVLPDPGSTQERFVQKEGFLEWKRVGGRFLASLGGPIRGQISTSQESTDYGGALAPDFLELRLGRIPQESSAWLVARGGPASRNVASVLLGRFPDWIAKGLDSPADAGVLGLWEEAGNLRAEWIFNEQTASDHWEKALDEARLGSNWKWVKQGRVISLQRRDANLWSK